jgi:hypothetical protein
LGVDASLVHDPASGRAWLELHVTDYGNVGKKTLRIQGLDLRVDGRDLPVQCSDAHDAELVGGGLLIQNTRSTHQCPLDEEVFQALLAARQIVSTVGMEGQLRKSREWSPKAVERIKSLTAPRR